MNPSFSHFWRNEPLTWKETRLLELVDFAHGVSASRGNISGNAVILSAFGSGDYSKAIGAALMTIGGVHGPIKESVELLSADEPFNIAIGMICANKKVPGWGNAFEKGHDDPLWEDVQKFMKDNYADLWTKVQQITDLLHLRGIKIYPNPSTYTALTAIALGIPADLACYLFIRGRLAAWSALFINNKPK